MSVIYAEPTQKSSDVLQYLTKNERAALEAFVSQPRQHYGNDVLRVVQFGSKAREKHDCDLDTVWPAMEETEQIVAAADRFVTRVERHPREEGAI